MAKASQSTKQKKPPFQWGAFVRNLSSFTVLVLGLGLLVGAILGMKPLEARAAAVQTRGPLKLTFVWPAMAGGRGGTWLAPSHQEQLMQIAMEAAGPRPEVYDAAPLARVSDALFDTGWFESPPRVTRDTKGGATVEGVFRVPAAVVRKDGKDHMISWDGKLMPAVYDPGESRLPVILDPALGAPSLRSGQRDYQTQWAGEDVAASIELLGLLVRQPWAAQVQGVEASGYSRDGSLAILTRNASRIIWGGRPSKPRVGEVTTRQKLAYLAQLQTDHKRIDGGYPLIYVNSSRLQFDTSASAKAQAASAEESEPIPGTP